MKEPGRTEEKGRTMSEMGRSMSVRLRMTEGGEIKLVIEDR